MTAVAGEAVQTIPGGTEMNVGSMTFNGSSSYLQRSHASQVGLDPTGAFSIICSSRPNPLPPSSTFYTMVSKWGSAGADQSYQFSLVESGGSYYLELKFQDSSIWSAVSAAVSPAAGQWDRYAVVFEDPGSGATWNIYFYENGTLLGGAPVAMGDRTTPLVVGTAAFRLGATAAGADFYDGNLDDIHFWKGTALSAASVNAWLRTMASGYEGMTGYWPLEPPSDWGTDWSPNDNLLSAVDSNPQTHSPYASFSDKRITTADWAAWEWPSESLKYRAVTGSAVELAAETAFYIYRMRGYDTTLGYPVYWPSTIVDATGADYAGPGPLTDIVVVEVGYQM